MSKRILAAACAAATALTLSACMSPSTSGGSSSKDGKLTVMASFYPLQYLAEKIGGEHVSVSSLTPDGAEPHDLELSPKMVDSLSSADAVIYLAGFQSAVDEAIEQQAPKTVIDVSPAAELIEAGTDANHPSEDEEDTADEAQSGQTEAHDHDHEGHDHEGHDHHHDMSTDPHFWLDPTRMAHAATLVGDKLAEADSAHADVYKANAKALAEELNTLSDTLVTKTSNCKVKTFVTAHTAFGYLADRTGLTQVGISGLDPESSPSPARLADIAQTAKEQGVTTIFTEALIDPKVAQTLADDLGITTAVLDPIESQTDASKDYAATMNSNIDALTKALDCQ
ncbi:High-affinity zinc uptake system binding-protein ZnuA [uncultured Actinomyces sp.]|nr:High-affinity zinc uptake system binding-protein ZnuA [uncultured Actinomyces sp.]